MRKDKFKQLAEARENLRLYRLTQKGKTDPKLTRDGCSPACTCICHIRRVHETEWERTLSEADRRLLR